MLSLRGLRVVDARRRGSSWPVIIETAHGNFLTKLRGTGQGLTALIAEIIVAELAETIGLRVPARAVIAVDDTIPSDNQDPELLDLLRKSAGRNLGFTLVDGARDFRREDLDWVNVTEASMVVWLDAIVANPDRTWKNPNLLVRRGQLWLIDHGAALGFHHDWSAVTEQSPRRAYRPPGEHVLATRATQIADWDERLAALLDREALTRAVDGVPDDFLLPLLPPGAPPEALARRRAAYVAFLAKRLRAPRLGLLGLPEPA